MHTFKAKAEGQAWNSPGDSQLLWPTGVIVNGKGSERNHQKENGGCKKEGGFSQKFWIVVLVVVLTALVVSQALQWVKMKDDERCPHLLNDQPPPPKKKGIAPGTFKSLEAILGIDNREHDPVQRQKRDVPNQIYITFDQYLEEQADLRAEMRQMANHPAARFTLRSEYISDHLIDTQSKFQWESAGTQSIFRLTPPGIGSDLHVETSGYYHISFTVMFNGRTQWPSDRPSAACSLKVAARVNNTHTTLLYVSRTQVGNGRRITGNTWPIDTAQASGVFLLSQGDVIYVKPGTFTNGCKIYTSSYKTHLDAFLIGT